MRRPEEADVGGFSQPRPTGTPWWPATVGGQGGPCDAWIRRLNRVDVRRIQPVDRLGAGWYDATTSGPSRPTDPGQRDRVGEPRPGQARAHQPDHGSSLADSLPSQAVRWTP